MMQVGLVISLVMGTACGTNPVPVPAEPKLPVPWQQLASKLETHAPHRKKHNHTNQSHSPQRVEREAGVHSKEDEAKFQADTEGVVLQPLAKDVATKVEMKLAFQSSTPKPTLKAWSLKEVHHDPSPSPSLNSSIDAMAVLHKEAESQVHKEKKHHEGNKAKQNRTSTATHHPRQTQEQAKHTNALANFARDMGVNTSHPTNQSKKSAPGALSGKKMHKGKHHKAKKDHSGKTPSVNMTGGDVMTLLHHEVKHDDIQTTVAKQTPAPTTTITTTHAPASKGLLHLREDMYLGGHPDRTVTQPLPKAAHHKIPPEISVVHSALSVGKKHHKTKYADVSLPKVELPTDPMAAVHKEVETINGEEGNSQKARSKSQEKPAATAASAPLKAEHVEAHVGGLARLAQDLGTNATANKTEGQSAPQQAEGSASQGKHSSHGVKHHKQGKAATAQAAHSVKAADKVDPMSELHQELHPKDDKPQPAVKLATEVPHAPDLKPKLKVHESRRNNLRKLREDER